jgi:hypothetical protein
MIQIVDIDSLSCGTVLEYCDGMVFYVIKDLSSFLKKHGAL